MVTDQRPAISLHESRRARTSWCGPFVRERVVRRVPDYCGQVRRPRGSGNVQVLAVPFVVITTCAVLPPEYVTTSERSVTTGEPPASVSVTFIVRRTVPAVGYALPGTFA